MTSAESKTQVQTPGDKELVVTRIFSAPRDLVFRAWTEREHLMNWWGPREWPLDTCSVDFRVGGRWHYCMKGPNGEEAWGLATYTEIDPPKGFTYRETSSDADGSAVPPEVTIQVELEDLGGGKTLMKNRATYRTTEDRAQHLAMGMIEGMSESLDRLEELLES